MQPSTIDCTTTHKAPPHLPHRQLHHSTFYPMRSLSSPELHCCYRPDVAATFLLTADHLVMPLHYKRAHKDHRGPLFLLAPSLAVAMVRSARDNCVQCASLMWQPPTVTWPPREHHVTPACPCHYRVVLVPACAWLMQLLHAPGP